MKSQENMISKKSTAPAGEYDWADNLPFYFCSEVLDDMREVLLHPHTQVPASDVTELIEAYRTADLATMTRIILSPEFLTKLSKAEKKVNLVQEVLCAASQVAITYATLKAAFPELVLRGNPGIPPARVFDSTETLFASGIEVKAGSPGYLMLYSIAHCKANEKGIDFVMAGGDIYSMPWPQVSELCAFGQADWVMSHGGYVKLWVNSGYPHDTAQDLFSEITMTKQTTQEFNKVCKAAAEVVEIGAVNPTPLAKLLQDAIALARDMGAGTDMNSPEYAPARLILSQLATIARIPSSYDTMEEDIRWCYAQQI